MIYKQKEQTQATKQNNQSLQVMYKPYQALKNIFTPKTNLGTTSLQADHVRNGKNTTKMYASTTIYRLVH